jgi:hypothetical protein
VAAPARHDHPGERAPRPAAQVLAVEEPNALAFGWGDEVLRFDLSGEDGGSRLFLVDELSARIETRSAAVWETRLGPLAGLEPARDASKPRFEAYSAAFEPILGPQEGPPPGDGAD